MLKYISLVLVLFLSLSSQAQVNFYAHVDNERVHVQSFFKIEFQLSDARGTSFRPPDFSNFKVVAGPSRSFQTSIVNGQMSSYESYSYTLQAIKEGEFEIGPASIFAKGNTIKTNKSKITVLPALKADDLLKGDQTSDQEYFVVAEIQRDTAYVGQQVLLDYRIFTRRNIDRLDFKQMPSLTDFHQKHVLLMGEPNNQVEISGQQYTTKLVKRIALFPKRPGTYTLASAEIIAMIRAPGGRGFFFENYDNKRLQTNSNELVVLPIPEEKPENYSGLVGNYTMEIEKSNAKLTTDDAITIRMRIKGNGEATRLTVQPITHSEGLDAYEPKIISRNKDENQKKQDHFALIEYLFTASKPGNYFVVPSFTYFDPDSNAFVSLGTDTFYFNVSKGKGLIAGNTENQEIYITSDGKSTKPAPSIAGTPFGQLSFGGLFLATLLFFGYKMKLERDAKNQPAKTTLEITLEELEGLREISEEPIAHRIEEILGNFFRNHYSIEESSWSNAELIQRMNSDNLPAELIQKTSSILEACKFAAYSGSNQSARLNWIDEAVGILNKYKEEIIQ